MTTKDLQQIDELVHISDMAVRVSSQLRLWIKRRSLRDRESVEEGVRFLEEAVRGGRFVDTGDAISGVSSLYPLTWSADIRFGGFLGEFASPPPKVRYDELVSYLDSLRSTLTDLLLDKQPTDESIDSTAEYFYQLGQFVGGKAGNALKSPAGGTLLLQDRFSYQ